MHENFLPKIAEELSIPETHVTACAKLLVEGGIVPFIARYRKEATGGLDEVQIANIRDRREQLKALEDRRAAILKSLEEQKVLTDELRAKVNAAETIARLEDVYLPYKPERRTKATIAREKGLEPLAENIFQNQEDPTLDPAAAAAAFVNAEKKSPTPMPPSPEPAASSPSGSTTTPTPAPNSANSTSNTPPSPPKS